MSNYTQPGRCDAVLNAWGREVCNSTQIPSSRLLSIDDFFNEYPVIFCSEITLSLYCIILVCRGSMQMLVNGKNIHGEKNSVFIVSASDRVRIISSNEIKAAVLLFQKDMLMPGKISLGMQKNFRLFNSRLASSAINLRADEAAVMMEKIECINIELADDEFGHNDEFIVNMFITVLIFIERAIRRMQSDDRIHHPDGQLVKGFIEKLEAHFETQRTVEFYARALHITPRKLNQVISAHFGYSVKKVIEQRVVEGIKKHLRSTDLTLKEISYAFGFTDPTNFNKYFKKYTQQTPAAYKSCRE